MGKDHLAARKKTPQVETGNKRPKRALLLGLVSRAGSDQSPQSPRANFDSSRSKITGLKAKKPDDDLNFHILLQLLNVSVVYNS